VTAEVEAVRALEKGPPTLDNGLINGTNTYNDSGTTVGSRFETTFVSGTSYRLRLINTAADTHFKFSIDNHTFQVIATDFVPIVPYSANTISLSMGQRYDIIVTANATADNYWLRAIAQSSCSDNAYPDNIKGIVRYDSTSTDDPTSTNWANATTDATCEDEDASLLVPYLAIAASDSPEVDDDFSVVIDTTGHWKMGNNTFVNQWDYPTVLQAYEGNNTWGASQEVYELPDANVWVYWVIETTNTQPHPMHLHGHDFWVLAQGTGTYDSTTALTLTNAPRRDTALLPGAGYLVIAFYTDNPGVSSPISFLPHL
jgi:FtsP/CotA-like multicopper oxidase with cupredoxin domain